ncbi:hypothetical protein [Bacillus thuringiensis]|uniref:hypothetical protein n=1 Tax=Bacillus thuringiensis TaxID=1428 RepID=UPI000BEE8037|nr:hypothetical protein [Bacillus thuringiensis]PEC13713.1 hypothetical protein CON19_27105 [Bacillus thuringiensis]PGH90421.1 hypothetical protein CN898_30240 [Bacillus thuringiensis]PGV65463.1 hypothetical protein COD96_22315 [Bacillus thuringiensis]
MFDHSYPRDIGFTGGGSYPSDIFLLLNSIPVIVHPTTTVVLGVYSGTIYYSRFRGKNIILKFSKNGWVEGFIDGKIPLYGNTHHINNIHLQELSLNKEFMHIHGTISTISSTTPEDGTLPLGPLHFPGRRISITGYLDGEYFSAQLFKPISLPPVLGR